MSTILLCLDGASAWAIRGFGDALAQHQDEGWAWTPSTESLTALRVAEALQRGNTLPQVRRQDWLAASKAATETVTLWELPQELYELTFLNAEETRNPETFGRRSQENKQEIEALLDSIAEASTLCVAITPASLQAGSVEANQLMAWLLRAIFRFTAALPCGETATLVVCDDACAEDETAWLKTNVPLLMSLEHPPMVRFATVEGLSAVAQMMLLERPELQKVYANASQKVEVLQEALRACKTCKPTHNEVRKVLKGVRQALSAHLDAADHLRWPLSPALLSGTDELPDLSQLLDDVESVEAYAAKAPASRDIQVVQAWEQTAPALQTMAGKGALQSLQEAVRTTQRELAKNFLIALIVAVLMGIAMVAVAGIQVIRIVTL